MNRSWTLTAGGVLMFLLGLARAAGGAALLLRGAAVDPNVQASNARVAFVGAALALLGAALAVAGVAVLRGSRRAARIGLALVAVFVIDGAINGTLLYGRPLAGGTAANVLAAVVIGALLAAGLRRPERSGATSTS